MKRSLVLAFAAGAALSSASTASAQATQSVPPAAPTIGASGGLGAGVAIPLGGLDDTHTAGFAVTALVDFSAAEQPFSFRAEFIYQHYDAKRAAPAGTKAMNIASVGASLLARQASRQGASGFFIGGIAVYRPTDNGTKPGVNAGFGLEVPLTNFVGMADVRAHYVFTEGKPFVTIPITLGARF